MSLNKRNYVRSKYITESARDETCTWPGCNAPAQCWAHSNLGSDGKGIGIKSSDIFGSFLCHSHHLLYDKTGKKHQYDFDQSMKRSWERLIIKSIIIILIK